MRSSLTLLFGLCLLPLAELAAQAEDVNERLARGGYAAWVRNRSGCTLTIDRANAPVPAYTEGMVFLSHDIFDAVRPDGTMMREIPPRNVSVDGRAVARASNTAHLRVWVSESCGVSVTQQRKAEIIGDVESRIRFLESERASDRRGMIIGGALAALSFGVAAHYSSSDAADADTYSAVGLGAGLGFLLGGFTLRQFDAEDRRSLDLYRRFRAELTRPY